MTWPRLAALDAYWLSHPPVHLLVAGFLGYKPPPEALLAADPEAFAEAKRRHTELMSMDAPWGPPNGNR